MEGVKGASKEKVRKIAGVERISTYLDRMQARFVSRMAREKYLCSVAAPGFIAYFIRHIA